MPLSDPVMALTIIHGLRMNWINVDLDIEPLYTISADSLLACSISLSFTTTALFVHVHTRAESEIFQLIAITVAALLYEKVLLPLLLWKSWKCVETRNRLALRELCVLRQWIIVSNSTKNHVNIDFDVM